MDLDAELPKAYELAKASDYEGATRIMFAAIHEHGMLAAKHPVYSKTVIYSPYITWLLSSDAEPFLKALHAEHRATLTRKQKWSLTPKLHSRSPRPASAC